MIFEEFSAIISLFFPLHHYLSPPLWYCNWTAIWPFDTVSHASEALLSSFFIFFSFSLRIGQFLWSVFKFTESLLCYLHFMIIFYFRYFFSLNFPLKFFCLLSENHLSICFSGIYVKLMEHSYSFFKVFDSFSILSSCYCHLLIIFLVKTVSFFVLVVLYILSNFRLFSGKFD